MDAASELVQGKATICITNYKTLDFTRLALRSIRKFTNYPYEVIVVDNDSRDESLDYLRKLSWIKLIERKDDGTLTGSVAEGSALDIGLQACNTEFFVAMHSDTIVLKENWLTDLFKYFDEDREITCVGTGKLELRPKWELLFKRATDIGAFKRALFPWTDKHGRFRHYNRAICCLYRTDVLKREKLSFMPDPEKRLTTGKVLYFTLKERKLETVELKPEVMKKYVVHLGHATQVIHPEQFHIRRKTVKRSKDNITKVMSSETIQSIITDDSLDS